jgi:hypothetical protein
MQQQQLVSAEKTGVGWGRPPNRAGSGFLPLPTIRATNLEFYLAVETNDPPFRSAEALPGHRFLGLRAGRTAMNVPKNVAKNMKAKNHSDNKSNLENAIDDIVHKT